MQKAIIVDLDGTLCDISHRRTFVENGENDWKSFDHPWQVKRDKLNDWCSELIKGMIFNGHKVIFVTGREGIPDKKLATIGWLENHFNEQWLSLNTKIFFRKEGDHRQDCIIKKEIFEKYIEPFFDITFVVDDRKQVVEMWRELGFTCLQCDEGDF